jgi:ankyrin repeat protein
VCPANAEQAYKCAAERWKQEKHTRRNLEPPICSVLSDAAKKMLETLTLGANPDVLDPDGETPLTAAIDTTRTPGQHGFWLVRLPLAHKGDPNLRSRSGLAPLHHAAKSGWGGR